MDGYTQKENKIPPSAGTKAKEANYRVLEKVGRERTECQNDMKKFARAGVRDSSDITPACAGMRA